MNKPVAFDIDGVVANFVQAHLDLIKEVTGKKLPKISDTFPGKWDYHEDYITPEEDKKVWGIIGKSPTFWEELEVLDEALVELLTTTIEDGGKVYFITNRFGVDPKRQTENFLMNSGIYLPTVLVAKDKAPILKSLGVGLFVDDKPENCLEASAVSGLKVIMPDRPYNRAFVDPNVQRSFDIVKDVLPFLE